MKTNFRGEVGYSNQYLGSQMLRGVESGINDLGLREFALRPLLTGGHSV